MIFFQQARGLDDTATDDAVRSLVRKRQRWWSSTDNIANVAGYGRLVENLGVTQPPRS